MYELMGKTVLITGASSGFGEALARMCAREGARLILCARRIERLNRLAEELRAAHQAEVLPIFLDVSDRTAVGTALGNLPQPFCAVDVLVNNAGLARELSPLQEGDPQDWERMLRTNVEGLLWVTRALLPSMLDRGHGDIVNVCSTAGHEAYPGAAVYCASKHAVDALTKGLRMDLVATPLRVHQISPAAARTEFSLVRFNGDKERADEVYRGMDPLRAEDVAEAILWALTRPAHVQIGDLVLYPTSQASATLVHRRDAPQANGDVWSLPEP
jgi:NADP-dependent 3-hydroxy acid dehydrogenase YdfG